MAPGEWIAAGSAVFTVVAASWGAVYIRGKLDGQQELFTKSIQDLRVQVERLLDANDDSAEGRGEQTMRNRDLERVMNQSDILSKGLTEARAGQAAHERECDRRYAAIDDKLDKIDRGLEGVRAEIRNVAMGRADRVYKEKP